MQKHLLTKSILLTAAVSLAACTSDPKSHVVNVLEEIEKENAVQDSPDQIRYEIPENGWELTPAFEHSVEYESGEEGSYTMIGSQEGVGFTGPFPIKAKDNQKYFWFYFGKDNLYGQPVEVKAVKKGTEELVDVLSGPGAFYESARVSPDSVNMPSSLSFPSAGIWKVLVYIEEEFYQSIVVEVV